MASSMIDSSLRSKAFIYQVRKRFSLPMSISKEECFIIYSKELEYHNCILNEMIRCLKDLHNKNQVYEFGKYLKDIGSIHNYTYVYELMRKPESSFTKLKRPKVIQAYRNIINEYNKWIEQDVHNIKEERINSIRKRINDYFKNKNNA